MKFQLFQTHACTDVANLFAEYDVNTILMKETALAFALCCALTKDDPDAVQLAEWFYPEIGEVDAKSIEDALRQMIVEGRKEAGEIEMSDFESMNPALLCSLSPLAHALYKLTVGCVFAQQRPVVWSAGDVLDISALLDFFIPMLNEFGLSSEKSGVSAAVCRLHQVFSRRNADNSITVQAH